MGSPAHPSTGRLRVHAVDLETGDAWRGTGRARWRPAPREDREPLAWDVREEGTWRSGPCAGAPFRGRTRWERTDGGLVVSHLRQGADLPVPIARLVPADPWRAPGDVLPLRLVSATPHLCGEDRYALEVRLFERGLDLRWTIRGPRKRIRLSVAYAAQP